MNRSVLGILAGALLLGGGQPALAKLTVVATTPDLGALAVAVGGDAVSVTVLAKPTEDPHFVDARPSHIVTLNRADVLIEGGAELELGWLPPLVEGARNAKIQPGAAGRVIASEGIQLLDVPAVVDRARGDIHAAGNPHFMMDPLNAKIVAQHIAAALCALDAAHGANIKERLAAFESSLDTRMQQWSAALQPYHGTQVVTYHATWRYFAQRFQLRAETYLEPKPGIPPSPPHLSEVIDKMNAEKIRLVLLEPYQSQKTAEAVASRTGATVVKVAQFPGALPNTDNDYLALMDANVKAITAALSATH